MTKEEALKHLYSVAESVCENDIQLGMINQDYQVIKKHFDRLDEIEKREQLNDIDLSSVTTYINPERTNKYLVVHNLKHNVEFKFVLDEMRFK